MEEDAWTRDDINALILGVLDIKELLIQLLQLFGDDEEEAPE